MIISGKIPGSIPERILGRNIGEVRVGINIIRRLTAGTPRVIFGKISRKIFH